MTIVTKIYLVDDDLIFLQIAKRILKSIFPEADVVALTNAHEGLKYLENDEPSLLFLDINMPVMDGWEFLSELAAKRSETSFPIIITSSSIDPDDRKKAQDHPFVNGFIEKPLTEEKILPFLYQ